MAETLTREQGLWLHKALLHLEEAQHDLQGAVFNRGRETPQFILDGEFDLRLLIERLKDGRAAHGE